jgi:arylesterase / paraoxonase
MSQSPKPYTSRRLRSRRGLVIMAVLAVVFLAGRIVWVNGVFSGSPVGFLGSCKLVATVPGVQDIEIVNGVTFVAVGSARAPDPRDGLYVLAEDGKLTKLAGAPKDFHPRGIGSYRSPDGTGIFLMAINRRTGASAKAGATNNKVRFSVDSFEVTNPQTNPALVAQGTIEGGLLTDPQDVAAAGPGAFYVSNNNAKQSLVKGLASWGVLPGSNILYFNGMVFRPVGDDVYGARGLALAPDGNHLLVASLTSRSLKSFSRDPFGGNLTEAGSLTLAAAPDKISLDSFGNIWVAGHANLLSWRAFVADPAKRTSSQLFRVSLLSGVPQDATQVYGNDGTQIAAASVGASTGKRLLIGSSLDGRLLDCTAP